MIAELVRVGEPSLAPDLDVAEFDRAIPVPGDSKEQYRHLLVLKNGFYAFDSSLHVFPFCKQRVDGGQTVSVWNAPDLWKTHYIHCDPGVVELWCFAENAFGEQFGFFDGRVVQFNPETGAIVELCDDLVSWCRLVVEDCDFHTGHSIVRKWQATRGQLPRGQRLVPIYPFVSKEGSYDVSNFFSVDALRGMHSRADFARQIKSIADGTVVRLEIRSQPRFRDRARRQD